MGLPPIDMRLIAKAYPTAPLDSPYDDKYQSVGPQKGSVITSSGGMSNVASASTGGGRAESSVAGSPSSSPANPTPGNTSLATVPDKFGGTSNITVGGVGAKDAPTAFDFTSLLIPAAIVAGIILLIRYES
jgi:hypothetical protein